MSGDAGGGKRATPPVILFVSDDAADAKALPPKVRNKFSVRHVDSYHRAQDILVRGAEVAVLVADLKVGGEDGIVFLANARLSSPETVRMVYTERSGFTDALNALNTGRAFRYVRKPCPPKELARFVIRGVQYYREHVKERQAMRRGLVGSVKALVDILGLVNPEAVERSRRIRKGVMEAGRLLGVKPLWRLELAVALSHIGCVALPGEILAKLQAGEELSAEEWQVFSMHPRVAASVLAHIEHMEEVAEIVLRQRMPLHDEQPIEARIIKAALDMDDLMSKGGDVSDALRRMRAEGSAYDLSVLEAMSEVAGATAAAGHAELDVAELKEGMVLAEDLVNEEGTKLLLRDEAVSRASLKRLQEFHEALGITMPVAVQLCDGEPVIRTEDDGGTCGEGN